MREAVLSLTVLVILAAAELRAQPADSRPVGARLPPVIERFVPPSSGIFVVVNDLGTLQEQLSAAKAEHFVPLFTGRPYANASLDPQSILTAFLGPHCRLDPGDLAKVRFGVAARSWAQLADGVLFIELPDDKALDRWFPNASGRAARISRDTRMFRLDGATVVIRDGILASSRANHPDALMRETMRLMAGRRGAITSTPDYQRLIAYLPSQPIAVAYLTGPTSPTAPVETVDDGVPSENVAARLPRTVVGVYMRDGRVGVAVRGLRDRAFDQEALTAAVVQRVAALPQTTLVAWAAGLGTLGLAEEDGTTSALIRYLHKVTALNESDPSVAEFVQTHPELILVWDRNPDRDDDLELAVLLRSPSPREVNNHFGRLVQRLLVRLNDLDPVAPEDAPSVSIASFSGTPISTLSFANYADKTQLPGGKLLAGLQPSWAVSGEWWLFALSRTHLQRLLDAEAGRVPTLAAVAEWSDALDPQPKRSTLVLARPAAAADLLDGWIAKARGGAVSLLNPRTLSGLLLVQVIQPDRLGIGMRADQEPGSVVVARVYPDTAADGVLQPGDRIVGIDGRLLNLESPNLDLRTRWHRAPSTKRTMRVLRDGMLIDVPLEFEGQPLPLPDLPGSLLDILSDVTRIGREVPHASFIGHAVEAGEYAAFLSVRLAPTAPSDASTASADKAPK